MDWAKQVMEKYQAAIDVYTKGTGGRLALEMAGTILSESFTLW